jgi:putative SOS response-associated peptidase YedK
LNRRREIHTRMPVILPDEHHDSWLSGEAGKEILVPFPAGRMKRGQSVLV